MTAPIPPGTFRLHPYAEPAVAAGRYTLSGEVSGLPGPVRTLASEIEVTGPRFALPPDQILGTFPPAGASGAFTSRLPQIVLRRRTLPWERSADLAASTAPTPWLALVLIAEGEGRLLSDVPVAEAVTAGLTLAGESDTPTTTCVEVPAEVVERTFPTVADLSLLAHVRAVDLADTELAMGDDDGWLAVVLGNRLPQPGVRYLACLVNLEGQLDALPVVPDPQLVPDYVRGGALLDLRAQVALRHDSLDLDTVVMGLPPKHVATGPGAPRPVKGAAGPAARTGAAWASTPVAAQLQAGITPVDAGTKARLELAGGFTIGGNVIGARTLRFPALAYWSFRCEERGDFQYLAEHVAVRLLGHVPAGPETPDGDPVPAGASGPGGLLTEPPDARPAPPVSETGHLLLEHRSRRGEAAATWYRGPLAPHPVPREELRPDGRPPLAHHADQLRRVVPDGAEDLGYASAFEIGRLLALSQPGVVAALTRWRQEAFGAARIAAVSGSAVADVPESIRDVVARPDPLRPEDGARGVGLGGRIDRAVVAALGADGAAPVGPVRPLADPGGTGAAMAGDAEILGGLGLGDAGLFEDPVSALAAIRERPVASAPQREPDLSTLRAAVEAAAMAQAMGAEPGARVVDALGRAAEGREER